MKSFTQTIHIIAVALLIGWGVSAVSAWTTPTVNPPATGQVRSPDNDTAQGVAGSINLTSFDQVKKGGIIVSDLKKAWVAPLSFFKKVLLPGTDTSIYIGGASLGSPSFLSSFPIDHRIPLTINLTGRPQVTDAVRVVTAAACPAPTEFVTDAAAFQFWRTDNRGDHADILAKGIQLTGGNPAPGKILIAVDANGRAVWAKPTLAANGVDVVFDTNVSPVGNCVPPEPPHPPVDPTCPAGQHLDWVDATWNNANNTCPNANASTVRVKVYDVATNTTTYQDGSCLKQTIHYGDASYNNTDLCVTYPTGNPPISGGAAASDTCQYPSVTNTTVTIKKEYTQQVKMCIPDTTCPTGQYASNGVCLCSGGIREGQVPNTNIQTTGKIITYENGVNQNVGGSGAPLVPYYVVLDEVRHNGGPGDACKIVPWDAACPAFNLDTMDDQFGLPARTFTSGGVTYNLFAPNGNSWEIDHTVGDQCTANDHIQVNDPRPLIIMNIER